ncbi:MAG: SUMF1/EgtB/PvdO family nonheme iron enzyme [Acidobacteriota bacterium]
MSDLSVTVHAPELVLVPAGTWTIGCDGSRDDEAPARRVTLPAFRAAVAPVTNVEYRRFTDATGHDAPPFLDQPELAHDDRPVVGVSWFDATAYVEWLSSELNVAFRLPTEAEREVASRGGLDRMSWPWGEDDPEQLDRLSNIAARKEPHVPGEACANAYGLRCMADNVHEWCSNWYAVEPVDEPQGPGTGTRRASRGGSWRHHCKFTRVSARSSLPPEMRYSDYGFRVYANA